MRLGPGEYKLIGEWLEKHREAHFIVYDEDSGLPVEARYMNPVWVACFQEPRELWKRIRNRMEKEITNERR